MWRITFLVLAVLGTTLAASIHHCSDESCPEEQIETTSFEFLDKLTQKQLRSIFNLTMVNASVSKVDPRLKYLKNLSYLDLSYNYVQIPSIPVLYNLKTLILKANSLKNINMTALPPNIEVLDISHNLLTHIPKDWESLKSLKTLHLYKNSIDCDCNNRNVLDYERLTKSSISVPESVTCQSPSKFQGKDISSVSCPLADTMLDEEPAVEGSGSSDIFETFSGGANIPLIQEEVEDEGGIGKNTLIDDRDEILDVATTIKSEDTSFGTEGSGDEGSGYDIPGCIVNCTPPGPVGANDSEFDSPPPSIFKQFDILRNDLNPFKEDEITSTTTTIPSTTTTTTPSPTPTSNTTEAPKTLPPVSEPKIMKETEGNLGKVPDRAEDIEVISNNTNKSEFERASIAPKDSTAVYAIIGVGLLLGVLFLIAFLKNRKSRRRQNKGDVPNANEEEMKPLSKLPITTLNEKPNRKSNIPESVPLIKGQNGKAKDDFPKLTSFTPLAHPELPRNGISNADEPVKENGHLDDEEEVDMRPKTQPELLTPQRERVTIRESEIPDSVPKTPLLVHRQKNSDGEIITMVVP